LRDIFIFFFSFVTQLLIKLFFFSFFLTFLEGFRRKKEEGVCIDDSVKTKLTKWHKRGIRDGSFIYYVAVDIGYPHTRVVIGISDSKFCTITKFDATDVSILLSGLRDVASQITECLGGVQASGAALDVSGLVADCGRQVEMTKYTTSGSRIVTLEDLPPFLFPPNRTKFLNDLEAACCGIMKLFHDEQIAEYFSPLSGKMVAKPMILQPHSSYIVCSVGVGLGSGLIRYIRGEITEVIPLEAGMKY
jgi:hypothetical protein